MMNRIEEILRCARPQFPHGALLVRWVVIFSSVENMCPHVGTPGLAAVFGHTGNPI